MGLNKIVRGVGKASDSINNVATILTVGAGLVGLFGQLIKKKPKGDQPTE